MSHSIFQPVPQVTPQAAGLFVPQALLEDVRLKPVERNAWMMFRSLADEHDIAFVNHESLRTGLLCAPGSPRAALSTVSRAVLSLRLTAWIEQTGYRRDPRTGFAQGASYTVRNEPLSFAEACLGSADYLPLLERGLTHTHVTVRELTRDILDQAMNHPDELARLSFALQEQVRRLHQRAYSSGGFRRLRETSLNGKHVEALLQRWKADSLSAGTIKNRLSHLRWWVGKIGKAGILPADNTRLGIAERRYVTKVSKAKKLGEGLDRITDAHVRMSLLLQAAFGLRREESIKFRPGIADQGDQITIQGSWAKGGRERTIPITTPEQRAVLEEAKSLAGAGSLIPANKSYIQQRNVYDGQCKTAGLSRMHGLRHQYAQTRYEALTGWKSPAAGGPSVRALSLEQRAQDALARQIVSRELGHERLQVTAVYLGR